MKTDGSKTAADHTATITALRAAWFTRIEQLHQTTTENAGLECAARCATARCCPQAIAMKDPAYAVGHVAIMLPFEMEYILPKTNVTPAQLRHASFELTSGISIDIGFVTSATPCPFLTTDYKCGIHNIRPLDCRSFPFIPVFNLDDTITFRVDTECPSVNTFSATYQARFKKVWEDLLPDLPMSYRMLYNQL